MLNQTSEKSSLTNRLLAGLFFGLGVSLSIGTVSFLVYLVLAAVPPGTTNPTGPPGAATDVSWYPPLYVDPVNQRVGIGTTGPETKLDVQGGDLRVSGFNVSGIVGSAKQTADVTVTGQIWTDIPDASLTFTLPTAKTVKMRAYGSVAGSGGTATYTHCGFRFIVGTTGYGHATWGDQIVGVGKEGAGHPGWWIGWYIERDLALTAGSHTIKLQMTGWVSSDCGCLSPAADYGAARLFVDAR